jgi:hypothetical protein
MIINSTSDTNPGPNPFDNPNPKVYHTDGMSISIIEYDHELKEFKGPRSIRLPKFGSLKDLRG